MFYLWLKKEMTQLSRDIPKWNTTQLRLYILCVISVPGTTSLKYHKRFMIAHVE